MGGAGIGLYTKERIKRSTTLGELIGTKGYTEKCKVGEQGDSTYIINIGGLCIDVWDATLGKVTCLVGFVNDPLDKRKVDA